MISNKAYRQWKSRVLGGARDHPVLAKEGHRIDAPFNYILCPDCSGLGCRKCDWEGVKPLEVESTEEPGGGDR